MVIIRTRSTAIFSFLLLFIPKNLYMLMYLSYLMSCLQIVCFNLAAIQYIFHIVVRIVVLQNSLPSITSRLKARRSLKSSKSS
jgi:hypothetical protein